MKKLLILLLLVSCSSFEYNNPLDKDSDKFEATLLEDVDFNDTLNYDDDDDNDGIKNYRDSDSKYFNEYFAEKEEEILVSNEGSENINDGIIDIYFKRESDIKMFEKVYNTLTFYVTAESNGDIISLEFDFDGDGQFEQKFQQMFNSKSHTYKTTGIKTAVAKVVDEFGNVAKDTVRYFVYDEDSFEASEKPEIILEGDEVIELEVGENYKESGFTVEDDTYDDNELAEFVSVIVDEDIRFQKIGEHTVTYTVYDEVGNRSFVERTVIYK